MICLLCGLLWVSCRQLLLSAKSCFMLSIHLFRCRPRLLFPVIYVCCTAVIGTLALFTLSACPNHLNHFNIAGVCLTVTSYCSCFLLPSIRLLSLLLIPAIRGSQLISAVSFVPVFSSLNNILIHTRTPRGLLIRRVLL